MPNLIDPHDQGTMRKLVVLFTFVLFGAGCGSKPPAEPVTPQAEPEHEKPELMMHGELGVLDEKEVRATFEQTWRGGMTDCQKRGGDNISGNTMVRMRVNHSGGVKWVYLKQTNLGDRAVEKCMLEALRNAQWPIPQGGDDGIAEQELPFADYADRPPVDWDADKVRDAVSANADTLAACRNGISGTFLATAIVNTNGSVASVGIQQPDETADEAADCMVEAIREMTFPKTGSWPAKVSFELP
jgi:predicted small lipoprotein YifL